MLEREKNFALLPKAYLFSEVAARVAAQRDAQNAQKLISLGIGDITLPLPPVCVDALESAAREMGERPVGYPPTEGYDFLRRAIAENYRQNGISVDETEIFVCDGAKSDLAAFLRLFERSARVALPDPGYPVYRDAALLGGFSVLPLSLTAENSFTPAPPREHCDLIFLCSPHNPTGQAMRAADLARFVNYAREHHALLLFDAAYRAYIAAPGIPKSIYEIPGAKECAVEFCSFSKSAGFTGLRLGWTVVPHALRLSGEPLAGLWYRYLAAHRNGVAYPVQRAGEAALTPAGREQTQSRIAVYRQSAALLAAALVQAKLAFWGGVNAPYLWVRCPGGMSSRAFFEHLLTRAALVTTPGAGFGAAGEGYLRLSAFCPPAETAQAAARLTALF